MALGCHHAKGGRCRFGREVTSELVEDLHALEAEAKVAGRFKRLYPERGPIRPLQHAMRAATRMLARSRSRPQAALTERTWR